MKGDDNLVKDNKNSVTPLPSLPLRSIEEITNDGGCRLQDNGGGKTVQTTIVPHQQPPFIKQSQRMPYSHLKKLLSSKPVLSLSASRSICSTTNSFGGAGAGGGGGAPTNPSQRIWSLLFHGIGIAVEDLYDLCELSRSKEQCVEALKVMHGYITDFETLLERIQDMAESGNEEQQRMLNIETRLASSEGMQHIPSATTYSTQPIGQPPSSPESPLKDHGSGGNVLDLYNDGDDKFETEEDGGLTEDAAHFVMEAIWTEAEALVEAEAKAEDDAWAKLTKTIEGSSDGALTTPCSDHQFYESDMECSGNLIMLNSAEAEKEGGGISTEKYSFGLGSDDGINDNEEKCDPPSRIEVTYPSQHSPTSTEIGGMLDDPLKGRLLHQKLSSPQREKPSPAEAKRRHDARQAAAELNRMHLAHGVAIKQKRRNERAQELRQKQDWARKQIVKGIRKRLDSAGARRAAHMQQIVAKANDENIKVDEVNFINRLTVEGLQASLHQRLAEVEARIQGGRERRNQHLIAIQRHRAHAKVSQMSAQQLEDQQVAAQRWKTLEKRLEDVHKRREERMSATLQCQEKYTVHETVVAANSAYVDETTTASCEISELPVTRKPQNGSQRRQSKRKVRKRSKHRIVNGSDPKNTAAQAEQQQFVSEDEEEEEEALRNTVTVPGAFDATTDIEENHHNLISPLHQQHTDIALLSMTSVSKSLSKSKLPSKVQSKRSKRAILKLQNLCEKWTWKQDNDIGLSGDLLYQQQSQVVIEPVQTLVRTLLVQIQAKLSNGRQKEEQRVDRTTHPCNILSGLWQLSAILKPGHKLDEPLKDSDKAAASRLLCTSRLLSWILKLCSYCSRRRNCQSKVMKDEEYVHAALNSMLVMLQYPICRYYVLCNDGGLSAVLAMAWAASQVVCPNDYTAVRANEGKTQQHNSSRSQCFDSGVSSLQGGGGVVDLDHLLSPTMASMFSLSVASISILLRHPFFTSRNAVAVQICCKRCDLGSVEKQTVQLIRRVTGLVDAIVRFSCDLKEERVVAVVDALIDASVIEALILLLETLMVESPITTIPSVEDDDSKQEMSVPWQGLSVGSVVIHALNGIAKLKLLLLQDALKEGSNDIGKKFRAVCQRMLSMVPPLLLSLKKCQHESSNDVEECLADLIILIGQFSLCHIMNQDALSSGPHLTILFQLCTLPIENYANVLAKRETLYPTLLSAIYGHPHNLRYIHRITKNNHNIRNSGSNEVVSVKMLVDFLKAAMATTQNEKEEPEVGRSEKWLYRFPSKLWENAIHELETGVEIKVE